MALASKPVGLMSKNLTKAEKQARFEAEERLKTNSDKIYRIPKNLSEREKELYEFLIDELKQSNILTNLDTTILELTANAISMMENAKAKINELGLIIIRANGDVGRNPAVSIYKDYNTIFQKCCTELGLSPSSRSRLALNNIQSQNTSDDELIKILND